MGPFGMDCNLTIPSVMNTQAAISSEYRASKMALQVRVLAVQAQA